MRPNGDVVQSSPKTHSRNPSTTSSASSVGPIQPGSHSFDGFVVAMHRKMVSYKLIIWRMNVFIGIGSRHQ